MSESEELKTVPLHKRHEKLGAEMVPFAGYSMPLRYTKIKEEHKAVRESAGVFDVSHMGRIEIVGPDAVPAVDRLVTNDVFRLIDGRAHYTVMCNDDGGIVDDLVVYRLAEDRLLLCVNGANRERDLEHIEKYLSGDVRVDDRSDKTVQFAIQGPKAEEILGRLTGADLAAIRFFRFRQANIAGVEGIIARTGYTGEDGFELYLPEDGATDVFDAILEGQLPEEDADPEKFGAVPCGLGCRDTLRLEAGLLLHGQDIDESTNPLEAGLSWLVRFNSKGDFVGRRVLEDIRDRGVERRLRGVVLEGKGVLRPGYAVEINGEKVGELTSGSYAPTLDRSIGLGYIDTSFDDAEEVSVLIRGRAVEAILVDPPFYKRPS